MWSEQSEAQKYKHGLREWGNSVKRERFGGRRLMQLPTLSCKALGFTCLVGGRVCDSSHQQRMGGTHIVSLRFREPWKEMTDSSPPSGNQHKRQHPICHWTHHQTPSISLKCVRVYLTHKNHQKLSLHIITWTERFHSPASLFRSRKMHVLTLFWYTEGLCYPPRSKLFWIKVPIRVSSNPKNTDSQRYMHCGSTEQERWGLKRDGWWLTTYVWSAPSY